MPIKCLSSTVFALTVAVFTLCTANCFGQYDPKLMDTWVGVLESKTQEGNQLCDSLCSRFRLPELQPIVSALKENGDLSNPYFASRYYAIYATLRHSLAYPVKDDSAKILLQQSLRIAYEQGDDGLISVASWYLGNLMDNYGSIEFGVMYCLNAADLYEKMGLSLSATKYWKLGEVLYKIREYDKTVRYCKLAAEGMRKNFWLANCVNTIALSYQKLGKYDSALMYYDSAYLFTRNFETDFPILSAHDSAVWKASKGEIQKTVVKVWKGIISGNRAQVYFLQGHYQNALPLFESDYHESKTTQFDNAANSLQWAAKTNLVLGNTNTALGQVRESFLLLAKKPVRNYYQNLYNTAADVYRAAGMFDSALYFSRRYISLHDSIEADVASSRLEISRMRLENEKNYYDIRSYQEQKRTEIIQRNLLIRAILLLAIIALLYMNSLRLKSLHRQEIIAEKNRSADLEIAAAKEQLETFTETLIEKSRIIDQLQQQLNDSTLSASQHEALSGLLQTTIITEDQWLSFKTLLEKIYPGFFHRLKESYPGITAAEQRMAALSKLKLSAREMAAMLGISIDSVHKTRQRLKLRLQLPGEMKLEEYIGSF